MVTVKIDEDMLVDMLMDRLQVWTDDAETQDLFKQMYENYADGGAFDGAELDIMDIVDNDYINWCSVIYDADENFQRLLDLYDAGESDVSTEHVGCSFIEAVSPDRTMILVRQ